MIHARSRRAQGPFVALNCAIMAPERFEAELFGVEAGADGEGSPRRVGVLERAHGGTLLLDEISEMPMETQSKIARVLQEQSFERVGQNGAAGAPSNAMPPRSKSISASSRPRHATWLAKSPPAVFARICITASRWCRCAYPR